MALDDRKYLAYVEFIQTRHHSPNTSTDPKSVTLQDGFSVCVIGASRGIGEHIAYAYAHARASTIFLVSRKTANLEPVAQNIKAISADVNVHTLACDIADVESVRDLATKVESFCPVGLDAVVSNPGASPPFLPNILHDDPYEAQATFLTNTVGILTVAKFFLPQLLKKSDGAKTFIAVASQGACLTKGFAAQPSYNTSKMAEIRLIEYISEQFQEEKLLAISLHPGSVLTDMSKKHCPQEYWHLLKDEPGLCGALCVWISKQAKDLHWLRGRFISSNWDVDELLTKKSDIVERDLLKFAMTVS